MQRNTLDAGQTKVDSFTITSIDGTTQQVSFDIHGTNQAAVIGTPTVVDVTEGANVNASGNLVASGSISISDVNQGEAAFQTTVTSAQGNFRFLGFKCQWHIHLTASLTMQRNI